MRPAGVTTSRATLDALKTKRPIIVRSSFGHTVLANTRALQLANITADTKDPLGGKIWRDASGEPTGLLEDAAFNVFETLIPQPTAADNVAAAEAALKAMRAQGITTFLDAIAPDEDLAAFATVRKAGNLTARAHFAPRIEPSQGTDPVAAVASVVAAAKQYDEGAISRAPGITVRNAKLFLDGVIAAPALTGAMIEPYNTNAGTADKPNWVAGSKPWTRRVFHAAAAGRSADRSRQGRYRSAHARRRRRSGARGTRRRRSDASCTAERRHSTGDCARRNRRSQRLSALSRAERDTRAVAPMGQAGRRHAWDSSTTSAPSA